MRITVVVPAYNLPVYTARSLSSLLLQDCNDFDLLLIDDHSPVSLKTLHSQFQRQFKEKGVNFQYVRNKSNLGGLHHLNLIKELNTELCLVLHHDDELVARNFISEAIRYFEADSDVVCFMGNAVLETSGALMVKDSNPLIRKMKGFEALKYMLDYGHTSWSSLVFKVEPFRSQNFPRYPYIVDRKLKEDTGLDCDEGFSTLYFLATQGSFAATGKIKSLRGQPDSQYSRSLEWRTPSHTLFVIYYCIYKYSFDAPISFKIRFWALISTLLKGINSKEGVGFEIISTQLGQSTFLTFWYRLLRYITDLRLNKAVLQFILSFTKGRFLKSTKEAVIIVALLIVRTLAKSKIASVFGLLSR